MATFLRWRVPSWRLWRARSVRAAATLVATALVATCALGLAAGCASPGEEATAAVPEQTEGEASFYGRAFAGQPTASGEAFDPQALTAAHPSLPMDTRVRVTNLRNDRSVVVRINDRGPYAEDRIIDVSRRAARRLGMLESGKARVRLEVVGR